MTEMAPLALDAKDTLKRSTMCRSGLFLDPWDVDPDDIRIEDIAYGLARIPRFCGQTPGDPLSVAQHSVYVSRFVPLPLRLPALVHDAPEFLTNDLPHHIKHGPGFLGMTFKSLERQIARAVEIALGLPADSLDDPAIKAADDKVFNMEWEDLVQRKRVLPGAIKGWPWERAEAEFLRCYTALTS